MTVAQFIADLFVLKNELRTTFENVAVRRYLFYSFERWTTEAQMFRFFDRAIASNVPSNLVLRLYATLADSIVIVICLEYEDGRIHNKGTLLLYPVNPSSVVRRTVLAHVNNQIYVELTMNAIDEPFFVDTLPHTEILRNGETLVTCALSFRAQKMLLICTFLSQYQLVRANLSRC